MPWAARSAPLHPSASGPSLAACTLIPPVFARHEVDKLRARGLRIEENPMVPGERKAVVFHGALDILLHRLGGLELANASKVSVTIRDGDNFVAYPHNVLVEVRATAPGGDAKVTKYMIPHTFQLAEHTAE
jgi:hypothetical protein